MSILLRARRQALFLLAALCCSAPVALHARLQAPDQAGNDEQRTVDVRVIEIAGDVAYIQPGEDAGLRVGQDVTIDGRRHRVVAVESDHAMIDAAERRLREGDRGRAQVRVRGAAGSPLEPPVPLSEFEGQWTAAVRPATQQHPQRVPLGGGVAGGSGRFGLTLIAGAAAVQPFVDSIPTARSPTGRASVSWIGRPISPMPSACSSRIWTSPPRLPEQPGCGRFGVPSPMYTGALK